MTRDLCCALCSGPHGVCLTRHTCGHHRQAQATEDANDRARQTHHDPTARQAINNITRRPRTRGRRR